MSCQPRPPLACVPALLVLVLAAACGPTSAPAEHPEAFAVVLLLAGPENDEGWNQSAYEGLQLIKEQLGARTRKITARTAAQIRQALSQAAEQNFDLVIGHGFEFNAPAAEVAAAYPEVAFVTTGGTASAANLASVVLRLEEVAYGLGILAAELSESGVISALSGEPFEPVRRVIAGLRAGAKSVRPESRVIEEYLGSWEDAALAKEKTFAHIEAGADILFQNVDAAGTGVFEACRARGLLAFGCNRDQSSKAADVVLASAVADIPETLLALAREVKEGRFRGGQRSFGLREDKVRLAFNEQLASRIDPAVRQRVDRAIEEVRSGAVQIPEL